MPEDRAAHFSASPAASPGEPVLHRDGYHGWLVEYDQRGNQIGTSIGLDGKPVVLAPGLCTRNTDLRRAR